MPRVTAFASSVLSLLLAMLAMPAEASPPVAPPAGALLSRDIQSLYPAIMVPGFVRHDLNLVVIGVASPLVDSSVAAYRDFAALPACPSCFRHVHAPSSPVAPANPVQDMPAATQLIGPALYATEAALASCPRCQITYVEAASSSPNDIGMATAYAVRTLRARLIVVPFNATEPRNTDADLERNFYRVRGLTLLVASGDNGSHSRVGMPATAPSALAVGGTTVTRTKAGWGSSSWGGTSATCDRGQRQPAFQHGQTDCAGRGVADLSAAANPDSSPFAAVVSDGTISTWITAGGTAVAAGLLAGWTARSNLAGVLTPIWLYRRADLLLDVTTGPSNRCVDLRATCAERQESPEDDCSPALSSPRTCVPGRGWDGLTGLGTPKPVQRESRSTRSSCRLSARYTLGDPSP